MSVVTIVAFASPAQIVGVCRAPGMRAALMRVRSGVIAASAP
jgi:hypothetical protein